jgi:hypothetical protein
MTGFCDYFSSFLPFFSSVLPSLESFFLICSAIIIYFLSCFFSVSDSFHSLLRFSYFHNFFLSFLRLFFVYSYFPYVCFIPFCFPLCLSLYSIFNYFELSLFSMYPYFLACFLSFRVCLFLCFLL